MKKFVLLSVFALYSVWGTAQVVYAHLSPKAQISLISSSPGELIFEAFGHSSLRIHDPALHLDVVYNYGTFDFFDEGFYTNFLRGYMRYYLSMKPLDRVVSSAAMRGIELKEQVLNLDSAQRQQLYELLEENRKEANKYYYYDYFYDNCATRYRDLMRNLLGDRLEFKNPQPDSVFTIRELMHRYLAKHSWSEFGIDLALGSPIDKPADWDTYMYLPDYLELAFRNAVISLPNGSTQPLVSKEQVLFSPPVLAVVEPSPLSPNELFWFLLAIGGFLGFFDWTRKRPSAWFDGILFTILGIIGVVLFFFWAFTNHYTTAWNYNLLWAVPFHLIAGITLFFNARKKWLKPYFLANTVLSGLIMLLWAWIPQDLHYSLVPLVFLIFIRSGMLYLALRKQQATTANGGGFNFAKFKPKG